MTAPHKAVHRRLGLLALTLGLLMTGLDATILTVALPSIATSLEATTTELQWFSNAYILPFAGLLLPLGVLGDTVGRRRIISSGLLLFTGGSVVGALAHSPNVLTLARLLMGAGAAAVVPPALALAPSLFPPQDRGRATTLATVSFSLGLPLGPLIGGWLLNSFGWESMFLLNIPVALTALVGIQRHVPETKRSPSHGHDLFGLLLSLLGLSALLYGVIEAPVRGWTDSLVMVSLFAGASLFTALVIRLCRARVPAARHSPFRHAHFVWGTTTVTVIMFMFLGVMFVVPQFLQHVQGHDPLATGIRLLPLILGMLIASGVAEKSSELFTPKAILSVGMLLWTLALALLAQLTTDSTYAATGSVLTLTGVALGLSLTTALSAAIGSLPPEVADRGSALANVCRQIGAATGVAVLGAVLNATYRNQVNSDLTAEMSRERADSVSTNIAAADRVADHLPAAEGPPLIATAREAFVSGMTAVALVSAATAAMMAVLVIALLPSGDRRQLERPASRQERPAEE